jgi:hypothetical protein
MRLTNRQESLANLYDRLSRLRNRSVTYQVFKDSWFVISENGVGQDEPRGLGPRQRCILHSTTRRALTDVNPGPAPVWATQLGGRWSC